MKKTLFFLISCCSLLLLPCFPAIGAPGGTAFCYQGHLKQLGNPVSGQCDLQFSLWNAAVAGTPVGVTQTVASVTLSNGLFNVLLDFGPAAFNGEARWLEIAVRAPADTGEYTPLSPRQELTPSPYAVFALGANGAGIAGTIPAAAIGSNTITSSMLATGAVTSTQLALGAAAANLTASGQSPVPGGGIILSSNYADAKLTGSGYVRIGKTELGDTWERRTDENEPCARRDHTAVWTGRELVIWGGRTNPIGPFHSGMADGAIYTPTSKSWSQSTTIDAPGARYYHTAVWTGEEMIIWGGINDGVYYNDGGRYSVKERMWRPMATDAPPARHGHTAVWTGNEMIAWGGVTGNVAVATGGRYDPLGDRWRPVSAVGAPSARCGHTAVWTGREMIIWGGHPGNPTNSLRDGAAYNPTANTWRPLSTTAAPAARSSHSAVWTGARMMIWGGFDTNGGTLTSGGLYNPESDTWTALNPSGTLPPRGNHEAIWTGSEMIVWAGAASRYTLADGGWRYDPAVETWMPMSSLGQPTARSGCPAVWTGTDMIVWGGENGPYLRDGVYTYTPSRTLYLYARP